MIYGVIGLLLGFISGMLMPIKIPAAYTSYVSIALLAALDSVLVALGLFLKKLLIILFFLPAF